ncbi:nuclear transport factor 2 family protein [Halioglobus maricola]|uniref:Nuclear transport factor 2 family protein n=1 Tax=Halioglobus maricola TaxID=2601894 RepID=A0A5P9NH40_9GAMM|nr:nuclear transport factor 2 family protein [Halioglobus maricola]QFU75147.1 nuclear transport factor 2 family protein [Halioglobus maricola]
MNNIEDELTLQDLMATYVDAANRRDGNAWASTWAEDGCWNLMGMEVEGREAILALWRQVLAGFEFAVLMPSSHRFEINSDRATGHWYLQEFTRDLEGQSMFALSRYDDEYVRVNGRWLFKRRSYQFIYQGPAELPGDYTALG